MKKLFSLLALCTTLMVSAQSEDAAVIKSLYHTALNEQYAYQLLHDLCKDIGPRPAGSKNAEAAVQWARLVMDSLGADRVILQEVDVPHWVRGEAETAYLNGEEPLAVCALGGSVGTQKSPQGTLTAEVIEVHDFEELKALGKEKVEGKIVFYNRPMDPSLINTGFAYGGAVNQRWVGALEASKYGAVGVLVRSMTLLRDDYPHTGSMSYEGADVKIPAAAVSVLAAEKLHNTLRENKVTKVSLTMKCEDLPRTTSYNVIGEWTGSEYPDEYIVVGGHLDSWELGEGAQDDGAGSTQSMAVPYYLNKINYKPKHTLRVVLFMNEEYGLDGAKKYALNALETNEVHLAAIESDGGSGAPRGFGIDGSEATVEMVRKYRELFAPYGIFEFPSSHSGADVGQLDKNKTLLIGYRADNQRYFDYHHAANDTFEHVNRRELELGAAAMTGLVYLFDKYGTLGAQ